MDANQNDLCLSHPMMPILKEEQNLELNPSLQSYISLLLNSHQEVPGTMTELYGGYFNYVMKRNASKERMPAIESTTDAEDDGIHQPELFTKFGLLAFDIEVKKKKVTKESLEKQYHIRLPPFCGIGPGQGGSSFKTVSEIVLTETCPLPGTYGLLYKQDCGKKATVYFKDTIIRSYLAAQFHLGEVLRKTKKKSKKLLSSKLIESVQRLPASGDLWRMTIGLMAQNSLTRKKQRQLLLELLDYSKTLITMSSYDMTSLCVESMYESRLASAISSKTLDDFTLNQTINFSNVRIKSHRLNYSIAAVGHLMRTNTDIFGLHLSKFGISERNMHLLSDPLKIVSDNSLQVLNLSGNEIGEGGIQRLERFLVKASLLTHLDLSFCHLFDAGVIHLSGLLICWQLIYLNLSENGVTDVGMSNIIQKLHYCPALEFLHLANNRLTDKSAVLLAQTMQALPHLRSLDLRLNAIGEEGVKIISQNSKHLRPMTEAECKSMNTQSTTSVWKTRSAKLTNFSLRKVPMGGVLKRSSALEEQEDSPRLATFQDGAAASALPDLKEEDEEEEEEEPREIELAVPEKKEVKKVKFHVQKGRQFERSFGKRNRHKSD